MLAPGYNAGRQAQRVVGDVAGAHEPDLVCGRRADLLDGPAEMAGSEGAAAQERVERDRANQRVALGWPQHLVELVDDLVRAVGAPAHPVLDDDRVAGLGRIGHVEAQNHRDSKFRTYCDAPYPARRPKTAPEVNPDPPG